MTCTLVVGSGSRFRRAVPDEGFDELRPIGHVRPRPRAGPVAQKSGSAASRSIGSDDTGRAAQCEPCAANSASQRKPSPRSSRSAGAISAERANSPPAADRRVKTLVASSPDESITRGRSPHASATANRSGRRPVRTTARVRSQAMPGDRPAEPARASGNAGRARSAVPRGDRARRL